MEVQSEEALRLAFPGLDWLTEASPNYQTWRQTYFLDNEAIPRAIARPQNGKEVSAIIRLANACDIPFTIRSGGHDLYGRSIVSDAICIDMRKINSVEISSDRRSAKIGGGVLIGNLLENLSEHGLVTPFGSVPSVGYVGWSCLGGYGSLSTHWGLGVDQIIDAEIVNAQGDIVSAGEDTLMGIRGACGSFGIVVNMRIKVYELKTLLAGLLVLDIGDKGIANTFKDFMLGFQNLQSSSKINPAAQIQPLVINHPQMGRTILVTFVWSSADHAEGQSQLDTILGLHPVIMNTVAETTAPNWTKLIGSFIASGVWGGTNAMSFRTLSPETLSIIGQALDSMPSDPGTGFSVHMLSPQSPSVTDGALAEGSCFNPEARQGHFMLELIGSVVDKTKLNEAQTWMEKLHSSLLVNGEAMAGTYVSLAKPESWELHKMYGENWDHIQELKKSLDPKGVFGYMVPRLAQ